MPGLLRNDSLVTNPNLRRYPRSDREWAHFIQELNRQGVALNSSGTFTPTGYVGFGTDPTGDLNYGVFGDFAAIWSTSKIVGDSDVNTFSFTGGVPVEIRPATTSTTIPCMVHDNGADTPGAAQVTTGGGMFFFLHRVDVLAVAVLSNAAFEISGTPDKGWPAGFSIFYPIGP